MRILEAAVRRHFYIEKFPKNHSNTTALDSVLRPFHSIMKTKRHFSVERLPAAAFK